MLEPELCEPSREPRQRP